MILFQKIRVFSAILWPDYWSGIKSDFRDPTNAIGLYALFLVPALLIAAIRLGYAFDFGGIVEERYRDDKGPAGLLRWLFPKKLLFSKSVLQDLKIVFLNSVLAVPLTLLALPFLAPLDGESAALHGIVGLLRGHPGGGAPIRSGLGVDLLYSGLIFIVVSFVYWATHWLMHNIPFLWELHKIHHTAEHLTGFTSSRAHFLELVILRPTFAVTAAATGVLLSRVLGFEPRGSANITVWLIATLFTAPVDVLFHTPYWISLGRLEYVFTSPAMHQIHHSSDPEHYNKNLGGCLSVFDFIFGTLHRTDKIPPPGLKLGIGEPFDWNQASYWQIVFLPIRASLSRFFSWKAP
jgi:sterol desaturase/sphingolipid hydroxylase (fatty acid hydroxylase superfamily)